MVRLPDVLDIYMSMQDDRPMRTTVRLNEQLMREAKKLAADEGLTFTALVEDSLRERLARAARRVRTEPTKLPVSKKSGGLRDGLDPAILSDNSRLADVMDGLDDSDRR